MNLQKSIELAENIKQSSYSSPWSDERDALTLLIAAGEFILQFPIVRSFLVKGLLPGETPE